MNLDQTCKFNLSKGRYVKDKVKWANTDTLTYKLMFPITLSIMNL